MGTRMEEVFVNLVGLRELAYSKLQELYLAAEYRVEFGGYFASDCSLCIKYRKGGFLAFCPACPAALVTVESGWSLCEAYCSGLFLSPDIASACLCELERRWGE